MTEYTWNKKTGKVKSKGKGKKPINLKKVAKNIAALTILPLGQSGADTIKKLMKKKKKPEPLMKKKKKPEPSKDLDKSKTTPDKPIPDENGAVWVSKGGSVKLAKKYF